MEPRALTPWSQRIVILTCSRTLARVLESDAAENRSQVERAEREAWNQKVRRADASTKLKAREQLLEQIQRSAAWKIVKTNLEAFQSVAQAAAGHRRHRRPGLCPRSAEAVDYKPGPSSNQRLVLLALRPADCRHPGEDGKQGEARALRFGPTGHRQ